MVKEGLVVGLDIGSTKITVLVGEVLENNEIYILGSGVASSAGVKKGVVVNIEEVSKVIESVISDAENMSDCDIDNVYVSIGDCNIKCQNTIGKITIPSNQKEITVQDKLKVQEVASSIQLESNYEILHLIPKEYRVDSQDGILDPVGMSGTQLEVETHIITTSSITLHNLHKSIKNTGLKIKETIFEGLAASEAVLTQDEKNLGVALFNIGGSTTEVVVFINNHIKHSAVIPIGSSHLTSDLAIGLRTSNNQAEKLKIKYGMSWLIGGASLDEKITISNAANDGTQIIDLKQIADIVEPRVDEMFSLFKNELKKIGPQLKIPAGIVLSGGGAMLLGINKFAEKVFNVPIRIGKPININGLTDKINTPAYASVVGLLLYGFKKSNNKIKSFIKSSNYFEKFTEWIKGFFKDIFI